MSRKLAILLLIITGVLWSTGGLLIKLIPWSPISIAGIRSGLSALIIYLYSKPYSKGFGRNIWAGAFCYSVMVVSFVFANKITASGNVILIQYAAPIYVALFGYSFLGEKASKIDWVTIAIIIFGLSCFFYEDLSLNQKWGNFLAIFSALLIKISLGGTRPSYLFIVRRRLYIDFLKTNAFFLLCEGDNIFCTSNNSIKH